MWRSNVFPKYYEAAVRFHNWLLIYSQRLRRANREGAIVWFQHNFALSRGDLTCRDGQLPSTGRPLKARACRNNPRGAGESRETRSSRMFPSANGDGGGFRVNCQPLPKSSPAFDSLCNETRSCGKQLDSVLRWIPARCHGDTSPRPSAEPRRGSIDHLSEETSEASPTSSELSSNFGWLMALFEADIE